MMSPSRPRGLRLLILLQSLLSLFVLLCGVVPLTALTSPASVVNAAELLHLSFDATTSWSDSSSYAWNVTCSAVNSTSSIITSSSSSSSSSSSTSGSFNAFGSGHLWVEPVPTSSRPPLLSLRLQLDAGVSRRLNGTSLKSVAAWVRLSEAVDDREGHLLVQHEAMQLSVVLGYFTLITANGTAQWSTRTALQVDQWQHVAAACWAPLNCSLYINGAPAVVDLITLTPSTAAMNWPVDGVVTIATPSNSSEYAMDEVWFFTEVLTPLQVIHLVQANSMQPSKVHALYPSTR